MATVNYGFSIQVSGGPQIAATKASSVEAYDKLEIGLDSGVPPKTLKFSNAHPAGDPSKKAVIEIFVGRDATP